MSIFDLFDDEFLPGDKSNRKLREDVLEYDHFKPDAEGGEIFKEKSKPMWIPYFSCLLVFGILLFQLLRLQITQGSFNRNLAEGNRVRVREVSAPRGLIYDSRGEVLSKNKASFNLEIYPLDLPRSSAEKEDIFKKLSQTAQIP